MLKLDDFLSKKMELPQVLDLSKVKITSKEEFKKNLDKISECKVKPEKILPNSVKIKDKDFTFIPGKREEKQVKEWNYPDPLPPDMKGAKLEELFPVNIDWKMLTTLRPKTKVEEDMFSRIVQLGKLDLKYQQNLKREKSTDWIRKTKNPKSSIVEVRVISCKECGEDFCDGSMCSKLMYENFFRFQAVTTGTSQNLLLPPETEEKGEKKNKKKRRRKRRSRKRSLDKKKRAKSKKNSIFNRPLSRGCTRDHSRKNKEVVEKFRRRRAVSSTRSFSSERKVTNFSERRSKSASRIHFDCDASSSRYNRYEYTSDSAPSHTDYSSQSDSESPDFHRKFFPSHLRLSGRRKLLSARVGFVERKQRSRPGTSSERSSKFVRRCTLYSNYHSDASLQNDPNNDRSSEGSTPTRSRSASKSPERNFPRPSTSGKRPSTIQIYFDNFYSSSALQFPDRMILPRPIPTTLAKRKDVLLKRQKELEQKFSKLKVDSACKRRKKKGNSSESKTSFIGSYLKAKGVFKKS